MQYRLRTLHIALGIGPPLIAAGYWLVMGAWTYPVVAFIIAYLAAAVFGPIALYRELITLVCGPDVLRPAPRRTRRKVRFRYERYSGST